MAIDYIIGIDPGKNGAMFVENLKTNEYVFIDSPSLYNDEGELSPILYFLALQPYKGYRCVITIEEVGQIQGASKSSNITLCQSLTAWKMAIVGSGLTYHSYHPRVWKHYYQLVKSDKEASRQYVLNLGDETLNQWIKFKRNHDRAEAYLIAQYGYIAHRRILESQAS